MEKDVLITFNSFDKNIYEMKLRKTNEDLLVVDFEIFFDIWEQDSGN